MLFEIENKPLKLAIDAIVAITKKAIHPVYSNLHITANTDGYICIKASDGSTIAQSQLSSEVTESGIAVVEASLLHKLVSAFSLDDITTISSTESELQISQTGSNYSIGLLPSDDFPEFVLPVQLEDKYKFDSKSLYSLLYKTTYSASVDDTKPHLMSVKMERIAGDGIRCVSTDGHRCNIVEYSVDTGLEIPSDGLIIPVKAAAELLKLASLGGDLRLMYDAGMLYAEMDDTIIGVKCMLTRYPPYQGIIPPQKNKKITIDRGDLLTALKRITLLSTSADSPVHFRPADPYLEAATVDNIKGKAVEELIMSMPENDSPVPKPGAFCLKYLVQALNTMEANQVDLWMDGPKKALLFGPADDNSHKSILMPVRIGE